jgi:hypothetical protein
LGSTLLIFLVILLAGAAAAYFFYFKPRLAGGPAPIPIGSGAQPTPEGGVKLQNDLGALKAGDALSFWDGTDTIVQGSLDCREMVGGRVAEWRWVFLSGDRVLELMPRGQALYEAGTVAHQGDEFYELLVGPGGALKRFEGNVREGISTEPVLVNVDDADYRVRATGTFAATTVGQLPGNGEVWGDVSQTHIAILRGRRIDRSEITGIFAK